MKQKAKRSIALLLALVMIFTFAAFLGACGPTDADKCENGHTLTAIAEKEATETEAGYEAYWKCDVCGKMFSDKDGKNEISKPVEIPKLTPQPHVCGHVCPTCGKCTDNSCTDPVCADKCQGHVAAHVCGHVCPTCGKCTDNSCTDPVCADKCQGHVEDGEFTPITKPVAGQYYMGMKCSGDVYYYLKGGMNGYYMATSSNKDDAVIVDLIADGEGWLLKQGNQYMEIEISGTHINAVYKATRTAGKRWSWDETYKIFTWENGTYFYGTHDSFNTVGGANYAQHAATNYKAQLGTFGNQEVVQPDPESVTLSKTGKVYLAPQAGNYIQLNATVEPSAAAQDIVWASSNKQAATVENGKVTYVGAGETVISATAKDTSIKAEVTIVVTDKGSKEQPLSVDEAIALMDTAGDGVTLGDANNKFYITGKVEEGSTLDGQGDAAAWTVNLLGTDGKKLQAVINHNENFYRLGSPSPKNGGLDDFTLVLGVSLTKNGTSYSLSDIISNSGTRPAVTFIKIDETAEAQMPLHAKLEVKEVLPANAQLDGTEQWHSSDESKATVDSKGEITGVAAGSVEVWVSFGEVQSNKCNVTITAQESSSKFVYDWTGGFTADTVCDGTTLFIVTPSADKLMEETVNKWTPGQTEITALSIEGKVNTAWDISGFGFYPGKKAASGTLSFTTQHQIKKVTIKLIAYSTGTQVEFTVNGQKYHQDKIDDKWDGKVASAFDAEIELSEATNNITIESLNDKTSQFAIVGLTLEW